MPEENKPYRLILVSIGVVSAVEGFIAALRTLGLLGAGELRPTLLRILVACLDGLAVAGLLFFAGKIWSPGLAQRARGYWLRNPLHYLIAIAFLVVLLISGFTLYHVEATSLGQFLYYIASLQPQIAWIVLLSFQGLLVLSLSLPDMIPTWALWRDRPSDNVVLIMLLAFVGVALYAWSWQSSPSIVSDSGDYLSMVKQPLFSRAFYLGLRPWTTALFYKLLPGDDRAIVALQTLLHAFSWGFLAWTVTRAMDRGWLRVGLAAILLLMALTYPVHVWNHVILSESIAISLFILMLALAIRLGYGQKGYFFPLALTILLWVNSRETNTLLALFLAGILLVAGLVWKPRVFYFAGGFLLLGMIAFSMVSSRLAKRSNFPLANIIVQRILVDPTAMKYFQEQGMPVNRKLRNLAGEWAFSDEYAIFNNPRLRDFYRWLKTEGTRDYVVYLLSHPGKSLVAPLVNLDKLLQPADGYGLPTYDPPVPYSVGKWIFIPRPPTFVFLVTLVLSLIGLVVALRVRDPLLLLVSVSGILIYPHAYLVWHGDALEIPRHAAQLYVQVVLSFWLLLVAWSNHLLRTLSPNSAKFL